MSVVFMVVTDCIWLLFYMTCEQVAKGLDGESVHQSTPDVLIERGEMVDLEPIAETSDHGDQVL